MRLCSFISGNTSIGTRYLYWILTGGPSFAVHDEITEIILITYDTGKELAAM
jgi:hypothetical protein